MKNRLKKGFTLVELLVTIVLLGVVGAIVIYNMTSVTSNSKESEYDRFIATIKSAAKVYSSNNPDAFDSLYTNRSFVYFTVKDLITNGLVDEELTNPYTEEKVNPEDRIKANLDDSGALFFEYPIEDGADEKETFLVALSDYVVWGEPYNCLQGIGTYQLALSDENGELIDMSTPEKREEFNFSCELPTEFNKQVDVKDANGNLVFSGFGTEEPGNYEIKYTWVTASGTRKSATRAVRVLAPVTPSFNTTIGTDTEQTPYAYDFESSPWYEPTYNKSTQKWSALYITPYIEGADPDSTTFTVTKQALNPEGAVKTILTNANSYSPIPVDDGHKNYHIETLVHGHHYKEYSYSASADYVIKSELVVPSEFISGGSTTWATDRTFSISDVYSPVGVKQYEYALSTNGAALSKALKVENTHTFINVDGITSKNISAINSRCTNALNEYGYIFFRAINNDGYVGKWSPVTDASITNHMAKLLTSDSEGCTNCSSCCLPSSSTCYYCNKVKYANFGGKKFILLERQADNTTLAAYDGLSANRVTPTEIKSGTYTVQTCDGTYTYRYDYWQAVTTNLNKETLNFARTLPSGYDRFLNNKAWGSGWGYVGTVTVAMFNKYSAALKETNPYWTSDIYKGGFNVHAKRPYAHGEYTTRNSSYFYAIDNGTISQAYAGSSAYVKPVVEFNNKIYVCGGNGSSSNPYVVATK